jgi:hypothetical protein
MVELLSEEAVSSGQLFTDSEKAALASESTALVALGSASDDLGNRAKLLIRQILERERVQEESGDAYPRNFGNSFDRAAEFAYPNIVALTEEVVCETRHSVPQRLDGWRWLVDKALLWATGIMVFLLMLVAVVVMGFLFHWK